MSGDMREFYDDPGERRKWGAETVAYGLYPTEVYLVEKYFTPGAAVLDVGCGGGREAFGLAERGFSVTAVDYLPTFVEACRQGARERGLSIEVREADALSLPFADGQFDHVLMVGQLLGHIRGRENRRRALREIFRVMKPGAAIVSTNAVERSWLYRVYFHFVNAGRKVYNPHRLEPYDAFVRRIGGVKTTGGKPIFHWYRTPEFFADAQAADWRVDEYLRRYRFERDIPDPSVSGETFYALRKETP